MKKSSWMLRLLLLASAAGSCAHGVTAPGGRNVSPEEQALFRAVDLDVAESAEVVLADGSKASVAVLGLEETVDDVRGAIREARVRVRVNGETVTLTSATYHLPVTTGRVQIDCPITGGYNVRTERLMWGLDKAVRLRLWPAGSPWMPPGKLMYPARQRWFATNTQMANEPSFVDGGEVPDKEKSVYYHWGLDIGGSEGLIEIVAATDGVVVSLGKEVLRGEEKAPPEPRYDVIYLRDARDWYYRYSHLKSFDPSLRLGQAVEKGQRIGWLGKEGGSGGWSHLHFDITSRQPSGKWGIQEGYAFLWEAYRAEHEPKIVAVARPHHFAWTGQVVRLDGGLSWSAGGAIARYDWTLSDGTTASGPTVELRYPRPGIYSELLKVTDAEGRVDYDFTPVHVIDKGAPKPAPPSINANYAPTMGIKPGDPVTFKVRSFRAAEGGEVWDFGDGTPPVAVKSDGNKSSHAPDGYAETVHRFDRPGHYVIRCERSDKAGPRAMTYLHVEVE